MDSRKKHFFLWKSGKCSLLF
ncbi:KxYKxGKxW signal peptide domain-containing protein [Anaerostipes sp. 494a]